MIKKLVSIIALIMTMVVLSASAYAYSNEFYSVEEGEGFKQSTLNETLVLNSADKDGNINIEMNKAVEGKDYFTQEEIEAAKISLTQQFKEYNLEVDKAEIQTFTPNNYRCIYIESHAKYGEKDIFFRQYLVYSGKYNYVITVTTYKSETADTDKYKNVVNSFKVTDYTGKYDLKDTDKPQSGENKGIPTGLICGIVGGIVGGMAAFFIVRSQQNKKGKK